MTINKISILAFSFVILALTSCNENCQLHTKITKADTLDRSNINIKQKDTNAISTSINYGKREAEIIDTIYNLKPVKDWQKSLEKQTNGTRHLQIWIADTPDIKHAYYYVQVGEDNGTNLVTHFNFLVYTDSVHIMYIDTENDDTITIKQWEKVHGM